MQSGRRPSRDAEVVLRSWRGRRLAAELQRTQEAAKRALVMQHEPDQHGNLMPKTQTKRLMQANRLLGLEQEISRLEVTNRELQGKLQRCAPVCCEPGAIMC